MPKSHNWTVLALLSLFLAFAVPAQALSQSCTADIDDVAFGDVANATVDVTATVTATCTAPLISLPLQMMVCVSIGGGGGGDGPGGARTMASGANTLSYQLYSDSGRSTIWGSNLWPYTPRPPKMSVSIPLLGGGSSTVTRTLYARFPSGQNGKPVGFYQSIFSSGHVNVTYQADTFGFGSCQNAGGTAVASPPSFIVSARKQVTCSVSASDVDFGAKADLTALVDGVGSLSVNCSPNLPYTVALGDGLNGTSPTTRRMAKGTERITYGLYRNTTRTLPWGDGVGETLGNIGTGATQNIPVYGRVPVQLTPGPGTYQDTVVVTITY